MNIFGRYSFAKFDLNGPQAFGDGGGQELVSLGGHSKVKNHSVAAGVDFTLSPTTILDVRFGFFKYKVDVLPIDFGTTPATDAGIPGLNLDNTFSSGLPYLRAATAAPRRCGSARAWTPAAATARWPSTRSSSRSSRTSRRSSATTPLKFGVDIRRAYNLRVPSDSHRSGQLYFNENGTVGPNGGGLGLATFLLGDVQLASAATSAPARTPARPSGASSTTSRTPGAPPRS